MTNEHGLSLIRKSAGTPLLHAPRLHSPLLQCHKSPSPSSCNSLYVPRISESHLHLPASSPRIIHHPRIFSQEVQLLEELGSDLDLEAVREGRLTPVFFGSAANTFGVQLFLARARECERTGNGAHPCPRPVAGSALGACGSARQEF